MWLHGSIWCAVCVLKLEALGLVTTTVLLQISHRLCLLAWVFHIRLFKCCLSPFRSHTVHTVLSIHAFKIGWKLALNWFLHRSECRSLFSTACDSLLMNHKKNYISYVLIYYISYLSVHKLVKVAICDVISPRDAGVLRCMYNKPVVNQFNQLTK